MKTNIIASLTMIITIVLCSCQTQQTTNTVKSPNGRLTVEVGTNGGHIFYSVLKDTTTIIDESFLGFKLSDSAFDGDFEIYKIERQKHNKKWKPVWGEESTIQNRYNELTVFAKETTGLKRYINIQFRVFDDGIGFRYNFPEQRHLDDFIIMDELTEFNIATDGKAWSIPWSTKYYEGIYKACPVSSLDTVCTPLTVELNDNLYISIHEAALTDYASMNLTPKQGSTRLTTFLTPWSTGEKVFVKAPFATPWRTIIVANKPGDLILSRIMLNLNEPNRLTDTSWIEPGRYIGIWWGIHMEKYSWCQGPKHGATTENTKRYIDFAAQNGFSGVLVEGWNYGWDADWSAEGDKFSFTKAYPDFDIKQITKYANAKGVKLIGHNETGGAAANYESQLDSAFALYHSLGMNAVKTGYVNELLDNKELHGSQFGVRHYRKVIETAAKYDIMIDNHEPVMPTGLQRTFPNLMTQEGVRGQEYDAWSPDGGNPPEHTTTIPFTRALAGPIDFTPGTFNFDNPVKPETHVQTTLAKQLALNVVIFSPLQMASDMIENYKGNPAFEFIKSCPTNWSKTVVPNAKIGEYVTIARKDVASDNWFVGSITNAKERDIQIPLSFLDKGESYKATIFSDGKNASYDTNPYPVDIKNMNVDATTILDIRLAPGGGAAIMIEKSK